MGASKEMVLPMQSGNPANPRQRQNQFHGLPPIGWDDEWPRANGIRTFPNNPTQQSLVDQIVFGRDVDYSGDTQYDKEFTDIFVDRAGRATWSVCAPETKRMYCQRSGPSSELGQVVFGNEIDVKPSLGKQSSSVHETTKDSTFREM